MRRLAEALGDEAIDAVEPVGSHRIVFEKRVVLRFGQFDQRAVGQQRGGAALLSQCLSQGLLASLATWYGYLVRQSDTIRVTGVKA